MNRLYYRLHDLAKRLVPIAARLLGPPRVIKSHDDGGTPYLSRYYLRGTPYHPDGASPYDASGNPRQGTIFPKGIGVMLHQFHRGDSDPQLHNHPWEWALSFVLVNGYSEERRMGDEVEHRYVPPFTLNVITAETFHRVDILEEAWTLFITGPKRAGSWGFWDRTTRLFTPWREFLLQKRGAKGVAGG